MSFVLPFSREQIDMSIDNADQLLDTLLVLRGKIDDRLPARAKLAKSDHQKIQQDAVSEVKNRNILRVSRSLPFKNLETVFNRFNAANLEQKKSIVSCCDPEFYWTGERGGFWSLENAPHWNKIPQDGHWSASRCGKCDLCAANKSMEMASMAGLEFYGQPTAYLVTRTFGSFIEKNQTACIFANKYYRMKMRDYFKDAPNRYRSMTAHEFGSKKGRRHFHDYVSGTPLRDLMQAWEAPAQRDPNKPGAYYLYSKSKWPYGFIHVEPIVDRKGAGYVGKYVAKSTLLSFSPAYREERNRMMDSGEIILSKYLQYPRPAIGNAGLDLLIKTTGEQVIRNARLTPHQLATLPPEETRTGLWLEDRPVILRKQDVTKANSSFLYHHGCLYTDVVANDATLRQQMLNEYLDIEPVRYRGDPESHREARQEALNEKTMSDTRKSVKALRASLRAATAK